MWVCVGVGVWGDVGVGGYMYACIYLGVMLFVVCGEMFKRSP